MSFHDYHVVCSVYTSEHSAFDQIRLSDKFGFRLNFGLGHALLLRLSVGCGGVLNSPGSVFLFFWVSNVGLYRYVTRTNVSFFDPSPNDQRTEHSCA